MTAAGTTTASDGEIKYNAASGSNWNRNVPMVWLVLNSANFSIPPIAPLNTHEMLAMGTATAIHGNACSTSAWNTGSIVAICTTYTYAPNQISTAPTKPVARLRKNALQKMRSIVPSLDWRALAMWFSVAIEMPRSSTL